MTLFSGASRIGFGCASLGSRVGRRQGLDALGRAHDAGINWFDMAPSYGDGDAEAIFGEFAKSRRSRIYVCTKCGITPARVSSLRRTIRPFAREFVAAFPMMRPAASRLRPAAERDALVGSRVRASLEQSLVRLKMDHVDSYLLHEPEIADLQREDVLRALEDSVTTGKAVAAGVAGGNEEVMLAARMTAYSQFQFAERGDLCSTPSVAESASASRVSHIVTHSRGRLVKLFEKTASASALRRLGYDLPVTEALWTAVLHLMLKLNSAGTVLLSMLSANYIAANLSVAAYAPDLEVVELLNALSGSSNALARPDAGRSSA